MACGCLQLEGELTIRADRSASLKLNYTLGDQIVAQLRGAMDAADRLAVAVGEPVPPTAGSAMRVFGDPRELEIRNYMRGLSPYGIECSEVRVASGGSRRVVRMTVACTDVERAVKAPPLQAAGLSFRRNDDGTFGLVRAATGSATNLLSGAEVIREVTPVLAGFRTSFRIRTPGAIVRTSARKHTTRSVVWEHDFNRDPPSFQEALSGEMSVTYRNP
jgi:hypothetical protein